MTIIQRAPERPPENRDGNRILDLDPLPGAAGAIERAESLGHDALAAEFARLLVDDIAVADVVGINRSVAEFFAIGRRPRKVYRSQVPHLEPPAIKVPGCSPLDEQCPLPFILASDQSAVEADTSPPTSEASSQGSRRAVPPGSHRGRPYRAFINQN
jgi:hypothetical protein